MRRVHAQGQYPYGHHHLFDLCHDRSRTSGTTSFRVPGRSTGRCRRRLPRHHRGRPVPVAGRHQLRGNGRVGQGRERHHVQLSREHPPARPDPPPHDRAVELRKVRRTLQERGPLLLHEERWPAEPERAVHHARSRQGAARAPRPQQAVRGRHRGTHGSIVLRGRQVHGLRAGVGGLGLEHVAREGDSHGRGHGRQDRVDQVVVAVMDPRRQGVLLRPLPRTRCRRQVRPAELQ